VAARLRLEDGRRFFIKAVAETANPDTPGIHRREARVLAALPETVPVPRLLWTYDEGGWVGLCLEDIDGRHPGEPWTESDLALVIDTLKDLATALTPSPFATEETAADHFASTINGWQDAFERDERELDPWCRRNLSRLVELEQRSPEAAVGETLLNYDVRADNLLIAHDRVYVLDWPWARTGAWWIDIVCMAPSVTMQGGPQCEALLRRLDLTDVNRESIDAVVCALAGYFVVRSLEPPPPGIPTVRAFQAAQGRPAIAWLRERTGWD
jgi:aminoglycoside phosphotransferase (APT) family kinase protein